MPKFTTPAGTTQRYIAALDRSAPDSIPGTKKVYADRAAFLEGIAGERACIAMGLPVWYDGIDLQILSEPAAVTRLWSLVTTAGSAAANAAASHGRTVVIAFKKFTLASDDNRVHTTTGAPASGVGDNGDLALDEAAGIIYRKAAGEWAQETTLGGGGGSTPIVNDLTTGGTSSALSAEQGKQLDLVKVSRVRQVPEVSNATLKASLRSALDGLEQNGAMPVKRGALTLAIFDTAANVVLSGTGTATLTDDPSDPYAGATGVRSVWADASARWLTPVVANQPYSTAGINLTGMNVEFSFKRLSTSTQALGTGLSLQLRSDASTPAAPGANRLQLTLDTAYGDPALNDDWQTISIPIERFNVVGTGADITSIKLVTIARGGQSGTHDVILGNVRAVPRQLRKAVCCICISDNRADTWTNAVRVLSRYGFPAVAQPGRVASNLRNALDEFNMSPRELRKLQQLHGWQIGSQAFTTETAGSLDGYTDEQFLAEISGIPRLYRSMGLWGAADGSYNPAIPNTATSRVNLLRQVFRTMRNSYTHSAGQVPWPETSPIADPMRLKSWSRGASNDGAQLIAYVQKAVQTKGMAVFSIHTWAADEPALVALCDWLHANRNDVDVVTIDTAIKRMSAATFNVLDGGAPAPDTTAPAFTSFAIANLTPSVINVAISEAYSGSLPAASAFTVTVAGSARTVNSVDAVDATHFNLTLASAVTAGQAVTAAYTKPGADPLKDAAGNETPNLAATPVTNNVAAPVTATPVRIGDLSNITESGDGTAGYTYTHNGAGSGLGGTGVSTLSFAVGASGFIEWDNGDTAVGAHYLGLKTQSGASGFASLKYGGRGNNPTSGLYRMVTDGTDAVPPVELLGVAKDTVRLTLDRAAATVTLAVKRFGESTWTTLQTWPGVPDSRYYIGINMSQANLQPMVNIRGVGLT